MKRRRLGIFVGLSLIGFFVVTIFLSAGKHGTSDSPLPAEAIHSDSSKDAKTGSIEYPSETNSVVQHDGFSKDAHSCQKIDIAVVCAGYNSTRTAMTLIKSMLFYRTSFINLHLIVDAPAKLILTTLFDTWEVANLSVSFYNTDPVKPLISWIPNKHYSGIYGLMKLTLPQVLDTLDRVIVLDTDIIFASDVTKLWDLFHLLSGSKVIGMVENLSDWYLPSPTSDQKRWPALGRGFNSGVILMDLRKLRSQIKWMDLWKDVAERSLIFLNATDLADQDIFNAVFKENPQLVAELPCEWNAQLSDRTRMDQLCPHNNHGFKIIHWNSPRKMRVKHRLGRFYKDDYLTFVSHDGGLLRRGALGCLGNTTEEKDDSALYEDICYDFMRLETLKFRTHIFFIDYSYESTDPHDVTLVAQLSFDRLQMLEPLCAHWDGPISLALYLSDAEAQQFADFVTDSPELSARKNVGYHIVYKEGTVYPVNYLRNVALGQATTPFVFLTDIDFLPMPQMYTALKEKMARETFAEMDAAAYVIPAFETQRYKYTFPANKSELLHQQSAGELIAFRSDVWPKGHETTNYTKWATATGNYIVEWVPDYEPYIVVKRTVPEYDRRFGGFGWNKVSHLMLLAVNGYRLIVVPDMYIIHMPHAPSLDIAKFRSNSQYRRCLNRLKQEFVRDLAKLHGMKATKYLIS